LLVFISAPGVKNLPEDWIFAQGSVAVTAMRVRNACRKNSTGMTFPFLKSSETALSRPPQKRGVNDSGNYSTSPYSPDVPAAFNPAKSEAAGDVKRPLSVLPSLART